MRLTGTCVLVLGVLAFAMPAYAGNGNGNGKGNAGAGEAAPGNSANAPGQERKDDTAAAPVATTTTTVATVVTTTAAPTEGVKPSNETAHETHAQARSDDTKLYGNGQNAGAIAIGHGASGTTVLHGPGNSQPHKAAPCSGGHERDVHALKGRHSSSCGGKEPQPHPTPNPPPHVNDPPSVVTTETKTPTVDPASPAPQPQPKAGGEANGVEASHSSGSGDTEGVLSATERVGRVASLPFTGQNLWIAVLAGVMLIAVGFALRQIRTVEALVESGHDHTDRARHSAHSSRSSVGGRSGR